MRLWLKGQGEKTDLSVVEAVEERIAYLEEFQENRRHSEESRALLLKEWEEQDRREEEFKEARRRILKDREERIERLKKKAEELRVGPYKRGDTATLRAVLEALGKENLKREEETE